MAKKSFKKEVFEGRLTNEINSVLRTQVNDPNLKLVSVTKVELSQDYSQALVYWDTFDSSKRGDIKKAMEKIGGRIRSVLAKQLNIRHTPQLEFVYDAQFEEESKITKLLDDEAEKRKKL